MHSKIKFILDINRRTIGQTKINVEKCLKVVLRQMLKGQSHEILMDFLCLYRIVQNFLPPPASHLFFYLNRVFMYNF
jgi:hypothetical protein